MTRFPASRCHQRNIRHPALRRLRRDRIGIGTFQPKDEKNQDKPLFAVFASKRRFSCKSRPLQQFCGIRKSVLRLFRPQNAIPEAESAPFAADEAALPFINAS